MPVDMKRTIAKEDELTEDYHDQEPARDQDRLRYWSLIILNANSYFRKIEKSSYYDEIEKICFSHFTKLFTHIAQENEFFNRLDDFDQELFVRYHCYALAGILRGWNEKTASRNWTGLFTTVIFSCPVSSGNRSGQNKLIALFHPVRHNPT